MRTFSTSFPSLVAVKQDRHGSGARTRGPPARESATLPTEPQRSCVGRRARRGQGLPAATGASLMTPAGLEPAIPGSVGRCLIHWATGPSDARIQHKLSIIGRREPRPTRQRGSNPRSPARESATLPTEPQRSCLGRRARGDLGLPAATGAPLMIPAGLEPAIPGSVGPCLNHWATGPSDARIQHKLCLLYTSPSPRDS